jgi:acetyltransferase
VGFSAFVSVGSMLDVGWGDLLRHFGEDPDTESIVLYMESVGDAAAFMEAARIVAARKPVIAIKVGRTAAAARAAASHTGAMTGSDDVLDAAFERAGVLRVDTIEELFDMAEVLAKQSLPQGPALAVVTNAGGPGALATDALVRSGGEMAAPGSVPARALESWQSGGCSWRRRRGAFHGGPARRGRRRWRSWAADGADSPGDDSSVGRGAGLGRRRP